MRKDVLSVIFLSIVMFMGIAISFNYLGSLSITGFVFGTANVTVGQTVDITLTIGNLDFGSINIGQTNNTTDFSPPPFVIENIGNTDVNITIYATNLWIGTNSQNPSYFYQFNTTINETGVVPNPLTDLANTTASTAFINVTNSTQVTGGLPPAKVVTRMNYTDTKDAVNVHINITAPSDEPQGSKSSTVTFTASQA